MTDAACKRRRRRRRRRRRGGGGEEEEERRRGGGGGEEEEFIRINCKASIITGVCDAAYAIAKESLLSSREINAPLSILSSLNPKP